MPVDSAVATALRTQLLASVPTGAAELAEIDSTGVYAWWGSLPFPRDFPPVDERLPLYVGIADRQTLGQRAASNHLRSTRASGLRRSLAAVLVDELELQDLVIRHPRAGKYALTAAGEARLTTWVLANLQVTWVPEPHPGPHERQLVAELLPPLNHTYATGSPFRRILAARRAALRAAATLTVD
ncbi:GIY-YIG nuclease family protein [Agromyces seonyuensis]|uniref:GIY-YIG catalytic domain-containing protein n=1 Tax=Agromyces seonyuensis TaxID=2662446 RepID=A0A6I4NU27_9MICO|nr:hypothetical protein [Agromyces seonyuensis]MWB97888.1 hypothetical protein [Agromyces seonyuensis]